MTAKYDRWNKRIQKNLERKIPGFWDRNLLILPKNYVHIFCQILRYPITENYKLKKTCSDFVLSKRYWFSCNDCKHFWYNFKHYVCRRCWSVQKQFQLIKEYESFKNNEQVAFLYQMLRSARNPIECALGRLVARSAILTRRMDLKVDIRTSCGNLCLLYTSQFLPTGQNLRWHWAGKKAGWGYIGQWKRV